MASLDYQFARRAERELGCGGWLRYDRDDPACRSAGFIFEHRMDEPSDERSLYGQSRLFTPILRGAVPSREFWINYLKPLHARRQ